ncbi:MAG TPA: amidohydrolase family protein [Vicinamibacterales bacterium]|nr:amidohydrolase family protein [Vicinamibacterales bacterium]
MPDAIRASEAVAAGQRTFEHLIGIFEASTPDEDAYLTRRYGAGRDPSVNKSLASLLDGYDPAREATIIRLLAAKQVWQCPTLFWERGQWLVDVTDYTKDPDLAYALRTWVDKRYPSMQKGVARTMDADPLAVRQRFVEHELEIVRRLHAAGVPFLAGTDTPAGVDLIPGISLHLELQRFVAAGFTPLEALQTATIDPARFLGKLSDFGSVRPGRVADLVILRANPLDDIANTRTIAGVVADGRYWSQADLDVLRARIRKVAAAN